jgi:phosphoserine phosphatase RsbU/P
MKVFPGKVRSQIRALNRTVRQLSQKFSFASGLLLAESLLMLAALAFLLSGVRSASIDSLGSRADLMLAALALLLLGVAHFTLNKRLAQLIEIRAWPAKYDERRLLFDLGVEARAARDLNQLYGSIVARIREALQAEAASIFVRDEESGDFVCRMIEPVVDPELVPRLAGDSFVAKRLRHLAIPLAIDEQDLSIWDRALKGAGERARLAREQECATLRHIHAALLLQITIKEQLVGILCLGPRRSRHPFSPLDKELLMSIAGQLAFIIENSRLVERMVAEERLRREIELATEVQQRLFPSAPPDSALFEVTGLCLPARGVGGDYFDFLETDTGETGIAVADVAGKGLSAALLMSIVQASLRSQAISQPSGTGDQKLSQLVATMNRLLWKSTGASSYATFFYAELDAPCRRLSFVNAGHNPPFLFRSKYRPSALSCGVSVAGSQRFVREISSIGHAISSNGIGLPSSHSLAAEEIEVLETGGPVLGVFEEVVYEQCTITVQSGDVLVAYTDGVTEAMNEFGEEFGEERLKKTVATQLTRSAAEIGSALRAALKDWCGKASQHDDLTFVVLKIK